MAAFEAVSKLLIRPHGTDISVIDVRKSRLPTIPPDDDDDFNPRKFRDPNSPISTAMAYFNLMRTLFGAGVLGLPLAISQAGLILGPVMCLATGALIYHTHILLLWCLNDVSRQLRIPYISYRYGFRMALLNGPSICHCIGNRGPTIIAILMVLSQIGICTVFVIFTADSLRDIMDWETTLPALISLFLPYLFLEYFMKTLTIISYVSLAGNFMNLVGMILVFYHIFRDPHGELVLANDSPTSLLFALGTFLFNMSVVGVVLAIDKAMVDPTVMVKRWGVVQVGILVPTFIATIFGTLGYWAFGTMEENILRSLPYDDTSSMVSTGLYLVAVAFGFPIQLYPGVQMIKEVIQNWDEEHIPSMYTLRIVENITRPTFVLLSFLIGYFVPFQAPFVAFVGNLCTTLLSLVFPALMELSLRYPDNYGMYNIYLIKDIIIIAIGLISLMFGVVLSAYIIYVRFTMMDSPNDHEI